MENENDSIEIKVPEVEFNGNDPLHRGAINLHVDRTDWLNQAMHLLVEARRLLDVADQLEGPAPGAMIRDVGRRVRDALKALDEQERADRDVYLALAETQRRWQKLRGGSKQPHRRDPGQRAKTKPVSQPAVAFAR